MTPYIEPPTEPAPSLSASCKFCGAAIAPDLLYCNAQHGIAYRKTEAKAAGVSYERGERNGIPQRKPSADWPARRQRIIGDHSVDPAKRMTR